jgi:hypothetical protein
MQITDDGVRHLPLAKPPLGSIELENVFDLQMAPIDPRFKEILNTVGLPGADEPSKPPGSFVVLAGYPTRDHSLLLFDAYCEHVSSLFNIVPPV